LAIGILFLLCTGFLREFLFIKINLQLVTLYYNHENAEKTLEFLTQFSYNNLLWIKWGLTAFFTILYLVITLFISHLIFSRNVFVKWITIGYISSTLISLLIYLAGAYIAYPIECYRIARSIMGVLQSPLPLMVFIPAVSLLKMSENSSLK
jgi:hypothetical protein